jgi:steroid delta-isomerase-like uncharacterized protein
MSEQNKAVICKLVDGLWTRRDMTVFDAVFSDRFVDRTPPPGTDGSRASFKQLVIGFQSAFPDGVTTLDDVVAEGDKVAWRWTFSGKHAGSMMGMPATGKHVKITGFTIDRISGGQIVERWHQMDMASMMRQLGMGSGQSGR